MKTPRRIPARTVRSAGATSYVNAATLAPASTLAPCYCAACSKRVEARGPVVIASRDCDLTASFDVLYCTEACRTRFVAGAL